MNILFVNYNQLYVIDANETEKDILAFGMYVRKKLILMKSIKKN